MSRKVIYYDNIKFVRFEEFPNYYVSQCGKVYSKNRNILMKLQNDRDGYLSVGLINVGVRKVFFVHRLVLLIYGEGNNNNLQVNHIDGNKQNNLFSNLEWVTGKQNMKHANDILKIPKGGRPFGAKDSKKRKTTGYFLKYQKIKTRILEKRKN